MANGEKSPDRRNWYPVSSRNQLGDVKFAGSARGQTEVWIEEQSPGHKPNGNEVKITFGRDAADKLFLEIDTTKISDPFFEVRTRG